MEKEVTMAKGERPPKSAEPLSTNKRERTKNETNKKKMQNSNYCVNVFL